MAEETQAADEIELQFSRIDRDGNGLIDRQEFTDLLTRLGLQRQVAVISAAFQSIDSDDNGRISLEEFRRWWRREEQD